MSTEAIPVKKAPKPSTKPKKYSKRTNLLDVTPEKQPSIKIVNEGIRKQHYSLHNDEKKGSSCQESVGKDMNGITEILPRDNIFAKPSMNSTKALLYKLDQVKNKQFDREKAKKELQGSEILAKAAAEHSKNIINYKLSDRKFKDLISLEVDENDPDFFVCRKKWKPKKKEKLDPFSFYFKEDFISEQPHLDFDDDDSGVVDTESDIDAAVLNNNKFDYLFDLYRHNEVIPFQKR